MNVGYILIVTFCVTQCIWPAVGLKLSLSNISSHSSPTLKDSTLPSAVASSPVVSKTSTLVDQPEITSNLGNAFNSATNLNSFPPKLLLPSKPSSADQPELISNLGVFNSPKSFNTFSPKPLLPSSSPSLFTSESVNTDASKLGSSGNLKTNNNVLSTIRNSLTKQNNYLSPQITSSVQSSVNDGFSSSKIEESSSKSSLNNNIFSSFNKRPLQSNTVDKSNLLLSQSNVESLSTNNISPNLGLSKLNNLQYNSQPYQNQGLLLNKINNNLKQSLPNQEFLDPVSIKPNKLTNNEVLNSASSYEGPRTNFGSLQSNILTNTQNIEQAVFNGVSTKNSAFDPTLTIPPLLNNNQIQTANRVSNSLIQNNVNSGPLLPNNLANKVVSETISGSSLSMANPYETITATTQTNINNQIPTSSNNNLIGNFNNKLNTNIYQNTILNNDLTTKNPNSKSLNTLQDNELQIYNQEKYLSLRNLLASRVSPDTTQNSLQTNTILGQNNLIRNNNQNVLSNNAFINNANLQSPTISVYKNPFEIQNSVNIESTSTITNDAVIENGVLSNTLPNIRALTQPNYFNSIPIPSTPIAPNFPEVSIPLYPDISSSNVLKQANVKSSPQLNTFLPNNVIQSSLLQTTNPSVDFQSPNILSETLQINSGSYLPTSNLDLINRFNILDNISPETLYSSTYPEYLKNVNCIPSVPSFSQNTNLNSQLLLNSNMELTSSYLSLNSNPHLPSTPQEIYDYFYPPIDTSIYKNTVFTESVSDDQNKNSIGTTESIEAVTETSSTNSYSIPSISDLPNVLDSNGFTPSQALLYNNISPSNLIVPQIENLLSVNDLTDSIIDLGNDVARRYIDYLWAKKAKSAYNPVFLIPNVCPPIGETFVPSPNISPSIIPSPSPILPSLVASIPPPIIDVIKEAEQSSQYIYPSLSTTQVQNEESQYFQPTLFPTDLSVFSPSVLPTPIINYPVYPPFIPTPPINFPPIPPLFPPMPSIIEMPILKMGSGGQDSRKWIEILLLASLLNNNDYCNDRGALEALIALMLAT